MIPDWITPSIVFVVAMAAAVVALYGLAAVSARGRARRVALAGLLAVLGAALVPIGAYELLAAFGHRPPSSSRG